MPSKKRRTPYEQFEFRLGLLIHQHMPSAYLDVGRSGGGPMDIAEAIARAEGPRLWEQMLPTWVK